MSNPKFRNVTHDHNGQPLHWGRYEEDGLPIRGMPPLSLMQGESDHRLQTCGDFQAYMFDLQIPEHHQAYMAVMDCICGRWFVKIDQVKMITPQHQLVYLEWLELYKQDTERG